MVKKKKKGVNILMQLDTCCTSECRNSHGLPMVMRRAFDLSEEMGFENNKCINAWKETPLVMSIMRMKSIPNVTMQLHSMGQICCWCQCLKLHWLQWSFTLWSKKVWTCLISLAVTYNRFCLLESPPFPGKFNKKINGNRCRNEKKCAKY